MSSPGTGRLAALATSPAAPAPGYLLLYFKTDGVLYIKDSSNVETAIGTASGITSLTGEATATGPGAASVTLSNSAVIGKLLTGFVAGPNSPVLATDTILQAVQKLQAQNTAISATTLAGDVTGPFGTTVVAFVGAKSAAAVAQSVDDTVAATASNTASTIVKRDASGNFSANVITANLTGTASGNEPPITATTAADYYRGDKTFQPLNKVAVGLANVDNTSDVNKPVSTAQAAADALVASNAATALNNHITDAVDAHDASAISYDNTTSGLTATEVQSAVDEVKDLVDDVSSTLVEVAQDAVAAMVVDTNSIDFTYTDAVPELKADLKISSNAEDAGFVIVQNNIESTGVTGLRSQVEADAPVQIGTSNFAGAANKVARADHVHSHGNQTSGTLHAAATTSVNGFMSAADKTKLDNATDANTPSTLVSRDGSGNFAAGTITANLTGAASANLLKAGDSMTGYFRTAVVALSDGPTINTDAALGNVFTVTIAGNRTFAAPTNPLADQKITYKIRQDAVGGRIITWDAAFNFGVDLSGVPNSTSQNIFDYYGFQYNSTTSKWDCLAISRGF